MLMRAVMETAVSEFRQLDNELELFPNPVPAWIFFAEKGTTHERHLS